MDDAKIQKLLSAKGKLEGKISAAVSSVITEWKKENDAEVTYINISVHHAGGLGQQANYIVGYTDVDLQTKDWVKISSQGITYPVPPKTFP